MKVLQIVAEDRDVDPDQRITYRITSGNPEGFFAINSSSGESFKLFTFYHPSDILRIPYTFYFPFIPPDNFSSKMKELPLLSLVIIPLS